MQPDAPTVGELQPDVVPTGADGSGPVIVGGIAFLFALALMVAFVAARVARQRVAPALPPPAVAPAEGGQPVVRQVAPPPAEPARVGLAALLRDALGRTRGALRGGLDRLFGRPLDAEGLEALEDALLRADVGVQTTARLIDSVRASSRGTVEPGAAERALRSELNTILARVDRPFAAPSGLWIVLVVGVNGSGKTTTIGKLAAQLGKAGRKVLVAAADTYRAAAAEQLAVWAERAGAGIVTLHEGADPGAVAFRAVERARAEGFDVVLVDTAGRLQTKRPLMDELSKVRRVLDKALPGAPHETLLVLDATIGQNALSQARLFHEATPVTGTVVTKLDGTAKGGMVLAIASELSLPVVLVGLGEKIGDLREFDPADFVDALIGTPADGTVHP